MDIGFAILLPDEPFNYARRIELQLANRLGSLQGLKQPPHITFKTPFTVEEFEPYADYLDELCLDLPPFDVTLHGFGGFAPRVLFLEVLPSEPLLGLHLRVLRDLRQRFGVQPSRFEGPNGMFHSTVGIADLADERFDQTLDWLRRENPQFTFTVQTLGVFYHLGPDAGWIVGHRSSLGAPSS